MELGDRRAPEMRVRRRYAKPARILFRCFVLSPIGLGPSSLVHLYSLAHVIIASIEDKGDRLK